MAKVLDFNNVSKSFCNKEESIHVLNNMNFDLNEGEIIAIIGPSGSGKTTILNLVSGLITPDSGKVQVDGEIGYMFQRDHLFEWRTIYKNVLLGLELKKIETEENINFVKDLLKNYGLWDFRNHYPSQLSGGMRQRVALIRTLAVKPKLLLLDEPFASLDYQTKLHVIEDVYQIIRKEKKSTIIVTHDISEAISLSDRIIVLSKRPASIKSIHEIRLTMEEERSPIASRRAVEFKDYFDLIWKELNDG